MLSIRSLKNVKQIQDFLNVVQWYHIQVRFSSAVAKSLKQLKKAWWLQCV